MSQKILQYIEIDVDYCSLTYGIPPCQASLTNSPPTGTIKCFNTLNTCQDRANFTNAPVTLRFAVPTNYLPKDIECIPNIKTIGFDPAVISLGQNLGQRATLTVSFDDHRHSDTGAGFDKYLADRPYDPYQQGTFWGKFRSRQPFVRGRPLRWITGNTDQLLSEMETRHYIIESFSGPDNNGVFKIIAKDILKLADGDRALAPFVSQGFLISDITNVATSLIVTPTGIGFTYEDTGYANIGGSEIVSFTHGGIDTFTKLLLHCDGSDASTTFTDASTFAHGNATVNGNAQVDTAQSKFGGASALFDGTGDYLTFADHTDYEIGSQDFAIDLWVRFSSVPSPDGMQTLIQKGIILINFSFSLSYNNQTLQFVYSQNGFNTTTVSAPWLISINTWYHVAATRKDGVLRFFINGLLVGSAFVDVSLFDSTGVLSIGASPLGTAPLFGWLDEIRLSIGTPRWTATFPVPSIAYSATFDTFTIVRGLLGTTNSAHSTQDRVQQCIRYDGVGPDDIIFDLLNRYALVDRSYLPLNDWHTEVTSFLNRVYSTTIAQPTSVNTLVSELIEQAGLSMWWDDRNQEVGMLVLRGLNYNELFNQDNIIVDTLLIAEQPDKRLSQVHTYFGQINPLTSLTDKANYRSVSSIFDLQSEEDYGSPAIKEIFSRWIPDLGRAVADRLGSILLSRFKDPPRKIGFNLLRGSTSEIILANGYQVKGWPLQDETGAEQVVNIQVTRMRPSADYIELEAEEVLFPVTEAEDLSVRNIIVDSDNHNINLRTSHDQIYPAPQAGITVILTINSGVKVGSTSYSKFAVDIGSWPIGVTIIVHVVGRIQGHGGHARGYGGGETNGGPCIFTRYPINLSCPGQIWSGGGGGGTAAYSAPPYSYQWGGGGGAGFDPGAGGGSSPDAVIPGSDGTTEAGGAGSGYAGAGGGPGLKGKSGTVGGSAGTNPGNSIDGVSFITTGTWDGVVFTPGALTGDVRGPQVN